MTGSMNSRSILPKLSVIMLTDLTQIPEGFTQETSLNGKYLKGIPTAVTDPDVDIGNATHTHTSDVCMGTSEMLHLTLTVELVVLVQIIVSVQLMVSYLPLVILMV